MNIDELKEAREVVENDGWADLSYNQAVALAEAARLVLDAEEVWWCETHHSVGPAPGPGGNPGMWYCHSAMWFLATHADGLIMCQLVPARLLIGGDDR